MTGLCRKCGERERAGKHRWCRECQAETKRVQRSNAASNAPASNAVSNTHDHAACHREMAMLRLDVERLKAELSDARKQSGALKLAEPLPPKRPGPRQRSGFEPLNVQVAVKGERTCGGPGRCGVIGCAHPGYGR